MNRKEFKEVMADVLDKTTMEEVERQYDDVMDCYNESAEAIGRAAENAFMMAHEEESLIELLTNNAWYAFMTLMNYYTTVTRSLFFIESDNDEIKEQINNYGKEIRYYTEEIRRMVRYRMNDEENLMPHYPFNRDNEVEEELFNYYFHIEKGE